MPSAPRPGFCPGRGFASIRFPAAVSSVTLLNAVGCRHLGCQVLPEDSGRNRWCAEKLREEEARGGGEGEGTGTEERDRPGAEDAERDRGRRSGAGARPEGTDHSGEVGGGQGRRGEEERPEVGGGQGRQGEEERPGGLSTSRREPRPPDAADARSLRNGGASESGFVPRSCHATLNTVGQQQKGNERSFEVGIKVGMCLNSWGFYKGKCREIKGRGSL